ncbi:MAG: thioesterase family protein [Polyangiaceae bacterium]|nr:thioesterase family protein [Polyangiaceae bacterium]MCE7893652.1 thioesterase family protein [Sorangiineae bacterium PRO1]MCL4754530.1 thioesterase family protein [Myxococcales bacterium]
MYELDDDTRMTELSPGSFRARVSDRWSIGAVPNGGYVMALGVTALERALPHPDPVTVTAHFLRPAEPGDLDVLVEVAKVGKSYSTASARLVQGGSERVRMLATFADLSRAEGPTHIRAQPPVVPPRDAPRPPRPAGPAITERFEMSLAEETMRWVNGEKSGDAEIRGWIRFADGRMPDCRSLPLFADAFPPPVFNVIDVGWVPTLELTVHVRARPASEWLRAVFRTRFLFGGHLEEDGELWDEHGTLVALSRQIAVVPRRS